MFKEQAGRHYWFAKYLLKEGYEPTIFCASTVHNSTENIDTQNNKYIKKTVNGIPFIFVKTPSYNGNGKKRIINMIAFYKNLFPTARHFAKLQGKPDVILASSVHPLTMVAGVKIAKKFGVPCICEVRDLWPEAIFSINKVREKSVFGKVLTMIEHHIYKKADAIIFTKEGDTDYIKEKQWDIDHGGDIDLKKCFYINNGVNLDAFIISIKGNKLDDIDLDDKKFNVVYAGSIRPVNNVGNILDAASLLKNEKDIQFLIYGGGNQEGVLKQRIIKEALINVKMKGFVEKKYIPYILSKSSINLLNYSHTQYNWSRGNSSNKLFEYMASGKPIISNIKMGYCILEKYKCGFSLEESTPEELVKVILKIRDMSKDEYEKMGNNAREGVKDFDFKVLTEELIEVINNVCQCRST